jgi:hypothetical protein
VSDTGTEYVARVHGATPVTPEQVAKLVEAMPGDAAEAMRTRVANASERGEFGWGLSKGNLAGAVEELRDIMAGYVDKCQRRPGLPHEECGSYLTRKGSAKFFARIAELAQAFETAFGLKMDMQPESPLDPRYYG